jgi:hypothetical protein
MMRIEKLKAEADPEVSCVAMTEKEGSVSGVFIVDVFLFVASELFLLYGGFHTNLVTEIACFYGHDSNARIVFIHGRREYATKMDGGSIQQKAGYEPSVSPYLSSWQNWRR